MYIVELIPLIAIALSVRCLQIIVNPPFSLFREYIAQLVEYNKKLLILGNMNAITVADHRPCTKPACRVSLSGLRRFRWYAVRQTHS